MSRWQRPALILKKFLNMHWCDDGCNMFVFFTPNKMSVDLVGIDCNRKIHEQIKESCYGVNELLLDMQRNSKSQPFAPGIQITFQRYIAVN